MDELLKVKEAIPDDGFTEQVIDRLPARPWWPRALEFLLPTAAVGILAPTLPLGATIALALGVAAYAAVEG